MKKRVIVAGAILILTLIIIFTIGNFKTGKVVSESIPESVNQEENNKASEILIGEVLSVITTNSTNCFKEKIAEFEINSVEKSENNLKKTDKITIVFTNIIEPFPYDCTSPSGISYAKIFEKDYLKVYIDKEGENYVLRLMGDSIECNGCKIIQGKCPKQGTRFNIEETLENFQIPKGENEMAKRVNNHGGSYCAVDKKIQYYKQINQECIKDYQCESDFCINTICSSNIGRESQEPKEEIIKQPETQEPEQELKTLSPFAKLVNWFKNLF